MFHATVRALFLSSWREVRCTSKYYTEALLFVNRNTSKSLSAQSLWELQEPLQRKRWKSEVGQTVLSAFEARSRRVESPRIKRRNARGVEAWESELRDLVWNGVPREMREEVYMSLSGGPLFFVGK